MLTPSQKQQLRLIKSSKEANLIHDVDFECFKNNNEDGLIIVDVGANRGQSIVSFKNIFPNSKIISFEANQLFGPVLEEVSSWYQDVQVYNYGLGRSDQELDFYVPVIDGVSYLEEGSTRQDNFEKPWVRERFQSYGRKLEFEKFLVSIKRAEDVLIGKKIDVIKIDVEGAEMDVLSSMDKIIEGSHPVFLIENSDWDNVTDYLRSKGYECYQYLADNNRLIPLKTACTNSFYIHKDYKGDLLKIVRPE